MWVDELRRCRLIWWRGLRGIVNTGILRIVVESSWHFRTPTKVELESWKLDEGFTRAERLSHSSVDFRRGKTVVMGGWVLGTGTQPQARSGKAGPTRERTSVHAERKTQRQRRRGKPEHKQAGKRSMGTSDRDEGGRLYPWVYVGVEVSGSLWIHEL